jgi:uncharacterized protein (DUF2147 family)
MLASVVTSAVLAAGALATPSGTTPVATPPVGIWRTGDDDSEVRIAPCGAYVCGYPVTPAPTPEEPERRDVHNPDPSLRGRPMRLVQIFKLTQVSERFWRGWIYSPRNGKMYHARLEMQGPEKIKLTGCLVGPLCESQTWVRAEPAAVTAG